MTVECLYSGGRLSLDHNLIVGSGGEGAIYRLPGDSDLVAKIYHADKMNDERAGKLKTMLANAPDDPMREKRHASIAWPVELLRSPHDNQEVIGFLMPRIHNVSPISEFLDVTERHARFPMFSYDSLCRTASNLASAVRAIHKRGYVIGDVNESNIMVTQSALVTLVDTDSFQVRDAESRRVYRCPVGSEMFTPPELHGKNFSQIDRTQEHDRFGLAVLFFQLLMEGTLPFAGIYRGTGEPPEYGECLVKGYFPYGENSLSDPPRTAPPFETLHPRLQKLFRQCFIAGHRDSRLRPDAKIWYRALKESESSLITCSRNRQHHYFNHCGECPWCERARSFASAARPNWDPFPSMQNARGFANFNSAAHSSAGTQRTTASSGQAHGSPPVSPSTAAPPPSSFSASATTVTLGQPVTLQWAVPHAQTIRISDQSGRRVFVGAAASGFVKVYPRKTSVYRLAASGVGVSLPSAITVSVADVSSPVALSSTYLELRQPATLKPVQVRLSASLSLHATTIKLRSPLKLNRYLSLHTYCRLRRVSSGVKNYNPTA